MPSKKAAVELLVKLIKEAHESVEEGELDLEACRHWHKRAYSALVLVCDEDASHVIDFFASVHAYDDVDVFGKTAVYEYNLAILRAAKYLAHSLEILELEEDPPQQPVGTRIFIGHGGQSRVWKDLREFLERTLKLETDEFDQVPVAGYHTTERLEEMLADARFAFLVMTGEDEVADKKRARQNVVHEVGLFQGKLGFKRAIVLWEEGCEDFSNIAGLLAIRFPKGNIGAVTEKIRAVLQREGIISK